MISHSGTNRSEITASTLSQLALFKPNYVAQFTPKWVAQFGPKYPTTKQFEGFFKTFTSLNVKYILPATLTLFGNGKADSKTLVMNAIRNQVPEVFSKWIPNASLL